jgi:hypothetical protein
MTIVAAWLRLELDQATIERARQLAGLKAADAVVRAARD